MDQSGCFFKALPDKGLVEKGKQAKGGKKSKQRFTIAFFVNAAGEKVEEPVVIWKSGMLRCFRGLRDPSRPVNEHPLSNPKSWMTSDVMLAVLKRFNKKLLFEQRKVIFFLDDTTCQPESMVDSFSQIMIIFLLKNIMPLDAGIIQNFKVNYGKRLMKYVLARINGNSSATRIIKDCKHTDGHSMDTRSMKRGKRNDNKNLLCRTVGWSKVMTIWWKLRKMT